MSTFAAVDGRLGRVARGPHAGRYAILERDPSETGWHIHLLEPPPEPPQPYGYDIWADTDDDVRHLLEELGVAW